MSRRSPSRWIMLAAGFTLGLASALAISAVATPRTGDTLYQRLELFAKVLSHIGNSYVEEVDDTRLIQGAIKGMVRTLDPHSAFLDPAEYKTAREGAAGERADVGLELSARGTELAILSLADDGPALRAGLRVGDVVTAVDQTPTDGLSPAQAAALLQGAPDSKVSLSVLRREFSTPRAFPLVRERPRGKVVEGRLIEGGVAYVRIRRFEDGVDESVRKLLAQLRGEAGRGLAGLVLDLRGNPGGLLEEGVKVADRFLESGAIVTTRGRGGRHTESEMARGPGTEPGYPLAVLVNGATASASEVLAGALQDQGRAFVFGARTYGKGSVQQVIELEDGSALKLTTARYYTPRGRSIQGSGIEPDVLVRGAEAGPEVRESSLSGVLANDAPVPQQPGIDASKLFPGLVEKSGSDPALALATRAVLAGDRFRGQLAAARAPKSP